MASGSAMVRKCSDCSGLGRQALVATETIRASWAFYNQAPKFAVISTYLQPSCYNASSSTISLLVVEMNVVVVTKLIIIIVFDLEYSIGWKCSETSPKSFQYSIMGSRPFANIMLTCFKACPLHAPRARLLVRQPEMTKSEKQMMYFMLPGLNIIY